MNPVWTAATISAIVSALITLLVAFGVPLTEAQTTAILGFIGIVAPVAVAIFAAPKVTPLSRPTDEDGATLVREDGALPRAVARAQARS